MQITHTPTDFADVCGMSAGQLRATLPAVTGELVHRIETGRITAEEVCQRLNVSSIDELLSRVRRGRGAGGARST